MVRPAKVWGDSKPGYWVVDAGGNAAAIAVNRLVAAGAAPAWTNVPMATNSFSYAGGKSDPRAKRSGFTGPPTRRR